MDDVFLFTSSVVLAFSGFTFAFYGILSENQISKEIKLGQSLGKEYHDDENLEYYSRKIEQWKKGRFFMSKMSLVLGLIIAFAGCTLNIVSNSWWTIILSLLISHRLYLWLAKVFKWRIQLISVASFLLGVILCSISIYVA